MLWDSRCNPVGGLLSLSLSLSFSSLHVLLHLIRFPPTPTSQTPRSLLTCNSQRPPQKVTVRMWK